MAIKVDNMQSSLVQNIANQTKYGNDLLKNSTGISSQIYLIAKLSS